MQEYKFFDLSGTAADQPIHPSKASLAKILDAIIRLRGRIHDTYSAELKAGEYQHPANGCAVAFRISLPIGSDKRFTELTGFELTEPPKIGLN